SPYSGGYGPSTPPPAPQAYATPAYGDTAAYAAPSAPVGATGGAGSGGKSNKPVLIGSGVVAVLAVIGVIAAIVLNGGKDDDKNQAGGTGGQSAAPAPADPGGGNGSTGGSAGGAGTAGGSTGGNANGTGKGTGNGNANGNGNGNANGAQTKVKEGDKSKTIEPDKCTKAYDNFQDKTKKSSPDFKYIYVDSVKECLQAAGWKYRVDKVNENTWGKGTVMTQQPQSGDPFDPKTDQFVLTVSTGESGS
ncbi:PASTA domain-containing protein, partial [Streptomyces sp. UNOB3_S3]|uniref:PASTA domain-containing protein n=1 Tax=Streptomyces sp. UNOB3_S3 TaxID=2871682 RepID=UPI001E347A4C